MVFKDLICKSQISIKHDMSVSKILMQNLLLAFMSRSFGDGSAVHVQSLEGVEVGFLHLDHVVFET